MRRRCFSLIELLTICAIMVPLVATITTLYHRYHRACRQVDEEVLFWAKAKHLGPAWRTWVSQLTPAGVAAGTTVAYAKNETLTLIANGHLQSWPLPRGANCAPRFEWPASGPPLAVLDFKLQRHERQPPLTLRLVAVVPPAYRVADQSAALPPPPPDPEPPPAPEPPPEPPAEPAPAEPAEPGAGGLFR